MAQCHLSWDSYKKNICNGFSHLQQHEEFVDMTLAAEGHLVKVHKSLLALASPYLKEVIKSAPCQHPVIFLTHISHEILGYIVEYVYTGEVVVPSHKMDDFIQAAKALHVIGINNLIPLTKFQNIPTQHELGADTESFSEDGTTSKDHAKILTAPVPNLVMNELPLVNTEDCNLNASQENNLISQNNLYSEDITEKIHTQQLSLQNHENVTYNCQYKKFLNPATPKLSLTSLTNLHQINTSDIQMLNADSGNKNRAIFNIVSEDTENAVEDPIDVDAGNNMSYDMHIESQDDVKCEGMELGTSVNELETAETKDYSINVELPIGNTGPPKITIQAGVIENFTRDTNPPNLTQNNIFNNPSVSNTIPKITINAGIIQDVPSINISRSSCPNEPDKTKETLINSNAASPLYIISGKGNLQMILNRFIYGIHHQSQRGRRWRCIDYRHKRCPAYVDSLGEKIVNRKFLHNHPFHDDKIMNRGSRKRVFESLDEVEVFKKQ